MSTPTSATEQGRELIAELRHIDTCLAAWMVKLDDFDTWGAWAEDGHTTCVSWLVDRCGLARVTAHEKLRVAKQLGRRKVLAEAMVDGAVSYSKMRVITRIDDGNEDLDRSLVETARNSSVRDLEHVVRHWRLNHEQEKPPAYEKRELYRQHGFGGGLDRIIIDLATEDAERLMNLLDTYLDWLHRHPVDEFPVETTSAADETPVEPPDGEAVPSAGIRARRVDALLDLLEHAAANLTDRIDVERAAIGVTVNYETLVERVPGFAHLASGATVGGETARRLACDAGIHRLIVKGKSEILDVGRKTRDWPVAQRRAIAARHGHRCAIGSCGRVIFQIHHIEWWENGGHTKVDNGVPLCLAHHHLVHEGGWTITYNPNTGITTLTGPRGQTITSGARL